MRLLRSRVSGRGRGYLRSPRRRLDHGGMPLVRGELSSCPSWPAQHRACTRRSVRAAVLSGVANPLGTSPGDRDIGIDPLATELVIDRCLAHGVTP